MLGRDWVFVVHRREQTVVLKILKIDSEDRNCVLSQKKQVERKVGFVVPLHMFHSSQANTAAITRVDTSHAPSPQLYLSSSLCASISAHPPCACSWHRSPSRAPRCRSSGTSPPARKVLGLSRTVVIVRHSKQTSLYGTDFSHASERQVSLSVISRL
jgi:hypothetical protein